MSHHTRTVILLIIVIIIVIAGWVWYGSSNAPAPVNSVNSPVTTNQSSGSQAVANTATIDTSDLALQNDLNSADAQLSAINTDAAAVDQSMPQ
jgi:hypothetical protein